MKSNVQWPKEWFNGYTYLTFEGLDVRVPLFYNEVLTRQYGNFMTIPSDVTAMNGRVHGNVIFAPDTPYKSFLQLMNLKDNNPDTQVKVKHK